MTGKTIGPIGPLAAAIGKGLPRRRGSGPLVSGFAAMGLLFAGIPLARADLFTVTSAGDPGASGLSLRQAVASANGIANSIVEFDPSLVGSTITLTQGDILVTRPMTIAGPGAAKLTISGGGASRIFNMVTGDAVVPVTISGVTLTAGHSDKLGSAILATNASLVLQDAVLSGNTAGVVNVLESGSNNYSYYAHLNNVVIDSNNASGSNTNLEATAFAASNGNTLSAKFAYCTISNNPGGAILLGGGSGGTVYRSRIASNSKFFGGAAIAAIDANYLDITASTIDGNTSSSSGGALYSYDTPLSVNDSVISGNSAGGNGGGIFVTGNAGYLVPSGTLYLNRSSVTGNHAYDFGAGMDIKRASGVYVYYSLVNGNTLTDFTTGANGGGLALQFVVGPTRIIDSTFYGNFAYHSGGGIGIFDLGTGNNTVISNSTIAKNATFNGYSNGLLGDGQPTITSSIVANNSNNYAQTQDLVGSFKVSYSLVKNASAATITGTHNIPNGTDPQLGPLAVNGGPTLSMLPAAASPVLNQGLNASGKTSDQRGAPRSATGGTDIGAVERQTPEVIIFRTGFDSS